MDYYLFTTEDMLNYCNVEVTYNDGTGTKTATLTKDMVDEKLRYRVHFVSDHLPATNAGRLDHTYTYTFDTKGEMSSKKD